MRRSAVLYWFLAVCGVLLAVCVFMVAKDEIHAGSLEQNKPYWISGYSHQVEVVGVFLCVDRGRCVFDIDGRLVRVPDHFIGSEVEYSRFTKN